MSNNVLDPRFQCFPSSLTRPPNWVCWIAKFEDGKLKKPPIQAAGQNQGRLADKTNPQHLCSFERAKRFYELHKGEPLQGGTVAGVGFVLTKQTGIVGIDLDHCVEDGIVNTWAAAIIESVGGFAELSPSGTGVHIYIKGSLPWPNKRTNGIEIYSHNSYLTVTGHWLRAKGVCCAAAA